jgi:hypothetical protein
LGAKRIHRKLIKEKSVSLYNRGTNNLIFRYIYTPAHEQHDDGLKN